MLERDLERCFEPPPVERVPSPQDRPRVSAAFDLWLCKTCRAPDQYRVFFLIPVSILVFICFCVMSFLDSRGTL